MNFLAVLGGSVVAILLIWLVSRGLGLGGDVRLTGRDAALRLAETDGFIATDAIVDRAGIGAIARDLWRAPLRYKLHYLLAPPGWSHDGSRDTSDMIRRRWMERDDTWKNSTSSSLAADPAAAPQPVA